MTEAPVALVTGASRGIGAAIALKLARTHRLALIARSADGLKATEDAVRAAGGEALPFVCDLTRDDELDQVVEGVLGAYRRIDCLVNNAGAGGPFLDIASLPVADWDAVFSLNVRAPFLLCQRVLPVMREQRSGSIVNIGSTYGLMGARRSGAYIASKHALIGLTRAIAAEESQFGIRTNCICPGFIQTEMIGGDHIATTSAEKVERLIPLERLGTVDEVADVVAFLCSPRSTYVSGAIWTVDGGLSATLAI